MKKYNYMVKLSYDGSNFFGWAKQKGFRTVQEEIENDLSNLFDEKISIFASGRTDKYVHALDQCFNFKSTKLLPTKSIQRFLNSHIDDIYIKQVKIVDDDFSSRFSIIKKTYLYKINVGKFDLFKRNIEYQYNQPIDLKKIRSISKLFIGEKDFRSFSTSEKDSSIRTIYNISVSWKDSIVLIKITGNGFLRNMVRMIVGTMIKYCENKISKEDILNLFENPKKGASVYKVDGCGLYLYKTYY